MLNIIILFIIIFLYFAKFAHDAMYSCCTAEKLGRLARNCKGEYVGTVQLAYGLPYILPRTVQLVDHLPCIYLCTGHLGVSLKSSPHCTVQLVGTRRNPSARTAASVRTSYLVDNWSVQIPVQGLYPLLLFHFLLIDQNSGT